MTVLPDNTNDKTLTWKSSDSSIATVDENGKVTPVKLGTCYITASSIVSGVEKKVELTVGKLSEKLEINCQAPDLIEGQKVRLIATVLPEDATDKTAKWTSSDDSVAAVDANGVVTALKAGKVKITATASDGSGATASVDMNVFSKITGISLSESAKTVEFGENFSLEATVKPSTAYDKTVSFKSSDESVATVDDEGKVTTLKTGSAVITATTADGKFSAEITLTVVKSAEEIRLNVRDFTLAVGGRVKVEYEVLPEGTTQSAVEWTTDNADVATVDSYGVITATGKGTATITVTVKGTSIRNTVNVTVE